MWIETAIPTSSLTPVASGVHVWINKGRGLFCGTRPHSASAPHTSPIRHGTARGLLFRGVPTPGADDSTLNDSPRLLIVASAPASENVSSRVCEAPMQSGASRSPSRRVRAVRPAVLRLILVS